MKILVVLAVALAGSAALSPALADPFQGPYVGFQVGTNHDRIGSADSNVGALALHDGRYAFVGGGFAGYDYKLAPKVVVSAEAGMSWTADDAIRAAMAGEPASIDPKREIDLTARAGYLLNPRTLVYVRGGYTNVRATAAIGSGATYRSGSRDLDGWTLGGGVERYLTSHVSARVEYRYADLSEGHGKYDRQQALLGVAYHF